MLFRGQPGFEDLLAGELRSVGLAVTSQGGGWVACSAPGTPSPGSPPPPPGRDLCFAYAPHQAPVEIAAESVNALATRLLEHFLASAKDERFDAPWPCVFTTAAGLDGLGCRA
ncbi:MAG: rRNA methyltransferase, partial [Burkholderiales bacterium]|nr:rRNA methyltransferase [Opitutaceae bacterium]